jgi:cytochrome c5
MEGHAMRRVAFLIRFAILVAASSGIDAALGEPIYVDQGPDWTTAARTDFYTRDQGSRLISLAWLQALKGRDGQPFLSDGLSRYGFLPNPGNTANLPIGIHATGPRGSQIVGITCSACHTRQLEVDGRTYRIDGGPAFIDFQAFLSDLDKAVGDVTASDPAFAAFSAAVPQSETPAAADVAGLRQRVDAWYRRFHAFVAGTLPPVGWGLGRLDAVGIIFNRISGTDVGPPPDLLIPENMRIADAPVRFPFLWNTPMQDQTDWAGFVLNGNHIFALARNTGQALAFANFEPKRSFGPFFDYANSINFDGLKRVEELVMKMGTPKWPREWPIDSKLADEGKKIYKTECGGCHGIEKMHHLRDLFATTWKTPVQNVGTDTRQYDELGWRVKTGAMAGAGIPFVANCLKEDDYAVHMMFSAVAGSILKYKLFLGSDSSSGDGFGSSLTPNGQMAPATPRVLAQASPAPEASHAPGSAQSAVQPESLTIEPGTLLERTLNRGEYEARVLEGIWAAAPYLHNGSVPTLAELLKPSAERTPQFNLGAKYDIKNVGLDVTQDGPPRTVSDCNHLNSGNSRCGHEFGTNLSKQEKKALLEYLKTL